MVVFIPLLFISSAAEGIMFSTCPFSSCACVRIMCVPRREHFPTGLPPTSPYGQRTEIHGKSTSMVWSTLGSRTAKEQDRTCAQGQIFGSGGKCPIHFVWDMSTEWTGPMTQLPETYYSTSAVVGGRYYVSLKRARDTPVSS